MIIFTFVKKGHANKNVIFINWIFKATSDQLIIYSEYVG